MVMLGFSQRWLVDAYTIKPPSPKLDSALGGEGTKIRVALLLGCTHLQGHPNLVCVLEKESSYAYLSLVWFVQDSV